MKLNNKHIHFILTCGVAPWNCSMSGDDEADVPGGLKAKLSVCCAAALVLLPAQTDVTPGVSLLRPLRSELPAENLAKATGDTCPNCASGPGVKGGGEGSVDADCLTAAPALVKLVGR